MGSFRFEKKSLTLLITILTILLYYIHTIVYSIQNTKYTSYRVLYYNTNTEY